MDQTIRLDEEFERVKADRRRWRGMLNEIEARTEGGEPSCP